LALFASGSGSPPAGPAPTPHVFSRPIPLHNWELSSSSRRGGANGGLPPGGQPSCDRAGST
jgi:hypothetical protein